MKYKAILTDLNADTAFANNYTDTAFARTPERAQARVIGYAISSGHRVLNAKVTVYKKHKRDWRRQYVKFTG